MSETRICRHCHGLKMWTGDAPLPAPLKLGDAGLTEQHCGFAGADSPRFIFDCPICTDQPITEHPDVQRLIKETVKLQAENTKLKAELATHRWIPVGERLPDARNTETEYSKHVLCLSIKARHACVDQYLTDKREWCSGHNNYSHWKYIVYPGE